MTVWGGSLICFQAKSVVNNWTATSHLNNPEKASDAIWPFGKNGWVSRCQENSYHSFLEWSEKAGRTSSHLLAGHNKEQHIIPQHQCGRSSADAGPATLEVIGSKRSYALKWCKPNNNGDNDDDDDDNYHFLRQNML